ncbi:ATP-binding protein [Streptomyces agglomeratus]|uniref:ATP-binding protein n=1 Tax=Streptomyces agglomeratus TaxID=285458 RepID=UPI00085260FA|nr:ATP-binding protein [Streptomyces agglomeratus]OEJ22100.1 ATP-binding protein [Streptomyces agglomeratus]OEJ36937.1 ATP-binding protein [Streptomyces agglomeratus]
MLRSRALPAVFIGFLAVIAVLIQPTTPAWADGDPDVGHCNSWVCSGVTVPGKPPTGGGGGGGGGGGQDGKTCATGATHSGPWPCEIPGIGRFDENRQCYIGLANPQPAKSDPIWQGHTDGAIYYYACLSQTNGLPNGQNGGFMAWHATDPLGTGPSAAELAQQAFSRMRLNGAQIGSAPPAGSEGLVGLPVWLWTTQSPQTWGPQTMTVSAGGLSVTVTAKVKNIGWSMGDGTTVNCTKPGTPYQKGYGKADSPDCGHRYTKVGIFTITATSTWTVDWTATNGETGTLADTTRTSTTTARIGELQVVN